MASELFCSYPLKREEERICVLFSDSERRGICARSLKTFLRQAPQLHTNQQIKYRKFSRIQSSLRKILLLPVLTRERNRSRRRPCWKNFVLLEYPTPESTFLFSNIYIYLYPQQQMKTRSSMLNRVNYGAKFEE